MLNGEQFRNKLYLNKAKVPNNARCADTWIRIKTSLYHIN